MDSDVSIVTKPNGVYMCLLFIDAVKFALD